MANEVGQLIADNPLPVDNKDEGYGAAFSQLFMMGSMGNMIPPWWSPARDTKLRSHWKVSDALKIGVNTFVSKASTIPIHVTPIDTSIRSHMDLAEVFKKALMKNSGMFKGFNFVFQQFIQDYLCLYGRSTVHLGGDRLGKTITIKELVDTKDPGPVLSVGLEGTLVERQVTDWIISPLGDRRWWWLSLDKASQHSGKRRGGLWLTEDHPVLTDQGWLLARDVKLGMKVASGDPMPSSQQMQALVGMMLGDAGLKKLTKRALLKFSHSVRQEDWLNVKQVMLKGFQWTGRNYRNNIVNVHSRASLGLVDLYNDWYKGGKKIVNREAVSTNFTPRMLATWYCDDGSFKRHRNKKGGFTNPGAVLYTNGFSQEDCEWLADLLTEHGYPCNVYAQHTVNGLGARTYYFLSLSTKGSKRFFEDIAPYIPTCMRYKLPDGSTPYDPGLWELDSATPYFDKVVVSEARVLVEGQGRKVTDTYHISVNETRNFVACNMVVHNTQDNGAFVLVLGGGPADGPIIGAASGLVHLESSRCSRTKSPEYPVIFHYTDGKRYRIHYTRLISMVNLPSSELEMNGVGLCPVSLCLDASQELLNMTIFAQEKLGSRPPRQVLYAEEGAITTQLEAAIHHWDQKMSNEGLQRFSKTLVMAPKTPGAKLKLNILDLASTPDGFDRQNDTVLAMAIVAASFGLDLRDLAHSFGISGQTRSDAEVQDRKGRGKGVGQFIEEFARLLTERFLPDYLTASFDNLDDAQDEAKANIRSLRSTARTKDMVSGALTERTIHQQMYDDGELTEQQFEEIELEQGRLPDGNSILSLFYSEDELYKKLLAVPGLEDPLDNTTDAQTALDALHPALVKAWQMFEGVTGSAKRRKVRRAIVALEFLEDTFNGIVEQQNMANQQMQMAEMKMKPGGGADGAEKKPGTSMSMGVGKTSQAPFGIGSKEKSEPSFLHPITGCSIRSLASRKKRSKKQ